MIFSGDGPIPRSRKLVDFSLKARGFLDKCGNLVHVKHFGKIGGQKYDSPVSGNHRSVTGEGVGRAKKHQLSQDREDVR